MEETKKIFSFRQIFAGSILGGPLAFAYLMGANFQAFNMPRERMLCIASSIISLMALFAIAFIMETREECWVCR